MATCKELQRQNAELLNRLDSADPGTVEYGQILDELSTNCVLQVNQGCNPPPSLPVGAWQIDVNGSLGQLDILSFYGSSDGGGGCATGITGDIVNDAGRVDTIDGSWDEANQQITFTRSMPGNITQFFTGSLSLTITPTQLTTLTGSFKWSDAPDFLPWSASFP